MRPIDRAIVPAVSSANLGAPARLRSGPRRSSVGPRMSDSFERWSLEGFDTQGACEFRAGVPSGTLPARSKGKGHLDIDDDGHLLSFISSRREAPLTESPHRRVVEVRIERPGDAYTRYIT